MVIEWGGRRYRRTKTGSLNTRTLYSSRCARWATRKRERETCGQTQPTPVSVGIICFCSFSPSRRALLSLHRLFTYTTSTTHISFQYSLVVQMSFSPTSFLSSVKHELAKAVQRGAEEVGIGGVYEEIPDCSMLNNVSVLSIKLAQPNEREQALSRELFTSSDSDNRVVFPAISYLIRDERNRKQTLMTADLVCNQGFVVKCGQKGIMELKMPNRSPNSIGKICHPFGATIYKVRKNLSR